MTTLRTANRRARKKRYRPYIWSSCRVAMRAWFRETAAWRDAMARIMIDRVMASVTGPGFIDPVKDEPCQYCGGSKIEEVYAGHGSVMEIPCSECCE